MYRSWQGCCRRGENPSGPSVSVESVDSEYWCLNNAIVYGFIMRLTVEERVLRSTFKLNTLYKIIFLRFYVLLTVHPCIIFFHMKPTRCTLLHSIFISASLHVSGNYVPIIWRTYCIYTTVVFFTLCGWLSGWDETATHTEWKIEIQIYNFSTILVF